MSKAAILSVRIDPDVKKKIEEAASREQRSMSNMVQLILAAWVEKKNETMP